MAENQESGAKRKRKETTEDILDVALNRERRTKKADEAKRAPEQRAANKKFANIESNPFYKIVFGEGDPEAKKAAVAKQLAYDLESEKSENKERLSAFELFKEWLMDQRKDMAQEIINLTDTDAFSELKDVFDQMNQGLLDFERQMAPLTDILDAVYRLRMASDGAMFDVFREIQEDKEEEARIAALRTEQDSRLESLNTRVESLMQQNRVLEGQKSWFGLGGTKKSALEQIARNETELNSERRTIDTLTEEIANTKFSRESKYRRVCDRESQAPGTPRHQFGRTQATAAGAGRQCEWLRQHGRDTHGECPRAPRRHQRSGRPALRQQRRYAQCVRRDQRSS